MSPESRHGRFRALRALYYFLEARHQLPIDRQLGIIINPLGRRQARRPSVPSKVPSSLSLVELGKVYNAARTPLERALIELIFDTGMRLGELVSIEREYIGEKSLIIKGKTGEHVVSISPDARDTLLSLVPSGSVFIRGMGSRYRGQPHSEHSLYRIIHNIILRAGIKKRKLGPHMLRHSVGRQMIAGGADLVTVQKQFGHKNIQTTRIYTELSNEEVHRVHQKASPLKQLKMLENGNGGNHGDQDEPTSE